MVFSRGQVKYNDKKKWYVITKIHKYLKENKRRKKDFSFLWYCMSGYEFREILLYTIH